MALPGDFGSGVSPILADGRVVLVRDQAKASSIFALDAANGQLKWEKKRLSPASYCTPVVWDTPAGKQVVSAGHGSMIGYDLKTQAGGSIHSSAHCQLRLYEQAAIACGDEPCDELRVVAAAGGRPISTRRQRPE